MVKIDFSQVLQRRRVSLTRWMDDEGINSPTQYEAWKSQNESLYLFSEDFDQRVQNLLPVPEHYVYAPYVPLQLTSVMAKEITEDCDKEILAALTEATQVPTEETVDVVEEPKKNKKFKDKKAVQTEEKDE